jgi:hypothetical protein
MIRATTMRILSTWFVGLFLIAQIFGVVSLLSEHTAHVAATELLASQGSASTGNIPESRHHRDDADAFIQHHELQDLNGTLTCLSSLCEIAFVAATNIAYVPALLVDGDPVVLERPPKPMRSV